MKTKSTVALSNSPVYNLLYAQDPDGRDLTVKSSLIAVVETFPSDDSDMQEQLYKALIKKYLSSGDISRFSEYEKMLDSESDNIRAWIESKDTILIDNLFFNIQKIDVKEGMIDEDGLVLVTYDSEECNFRPAEETDTLYESEFVPVVNKASISSPFITASPFVVVDGKQYLSDKDGNAIGEPYTQVFYAQGPYMVSRGKGVGLVEVSGVEVLPCIYERIGHEAGNVISFDQAGLTGFYIPSLGLICPPKFEDIDFGDGEEPIRVLTETGWGFIDRNLRVHLIESWENGECDEVSFL